MVQLRMLMPVCNWQTLRYAWTVQVYAACCFRQEHGGERHCLYSFTWCSTLQGLAF